ncbi:MULTISPECIES: acyltransferase family protein [Rhodococcus]|uniref:Acyltransferase n=1 Tax=Rhodococcus rhodochrous TaxID=1829 RepID=A0AA46WVC7_RHORH|nr:MULTISPECIES: acyltransferase [Rhodococcus]MBF4480036.1 acyltransferase [Rhodococcus rhodochrous]MCB8910256.1 acyltransferase [Rhodococcus rhodochrous]MCD2098826.1 acyltransferase [Rhodococcus rhodochrous]MCD2123296.1 acyltransferase [Rhodococcus rhodochrous]MCQ4136068.1 acyltransferase [Rhodococcus rhodochrous]
MTTTTDRNRSVSGFLPALEGMRGFAAVGVLITHVAFQTGAVHDSPIGRVWARFDLAVALFFALSGFLLWRPHAAAARGFGPSPSATRYFLSRATRILPAYWTVVILVLWLLPGAGGGAKVWWSNLTLVQVFVPLTLTEGLTQMWSLSVEVAFYLVLPLLALAVSGLRGDAARYRVPLLLAVSGLSLLWAWIPVGTPDHINHTNWLPGYLPWFAAGMILAELVTGPETWIHRLAARRAVMGAIAVGAFAAAATPLAGPETLTDLAPSEYFAKIALGAIMSFALLAPLTLAPRRQHRVLASPVALAVGRWSYGLFIWHLAVLSIVFPVFGIPAFAGHFWFVLTVTVVLSLAVASVSYALVEEPARAAFHRWDKARRGTAARPTATTPTSAAN